MLGFEIRRSIQNRQLVVFFESLGHNNPIQYVEYSMGRFVSFLRPIKSFMSILDPIIGSSSKKEHLKVLLYYLQTNTTISDLFLHPAAWYLHTQIIKIRVPMSSYSCKLLQFGNTSRSLQPKSSRAPEMYAQNRILLIQLKSSTIGSYM